MRLALSLRLWLYASKAGPYVRKSAKESGQAVEDVYRNLASGKDPNFQRFVDTSTKFLGDVAGELPKGKIRGIAARNVQRRGGDTRRTRLAADRDRAARRDRE